MIILEGPDGAGKTTLVKHLQEDFGLAVGLRGTEDRTKLYEVTVSDTFRAIRGAFEFGSPPLLWDRLYYSELVYYRYTTGKCAFNHAQQKLIRHVIQAIGCPVILCLPPLEVVVNCVLEDDRDEMEGVKTNIHAIYHAYEHMDLGNVLPVQTLVYDYTKDPREIVTTYIENYLAIRQRRAA